jgi:PAS domain S-box-containing protein
VKWSWATLGLLAPRTRSVILLLLFAATAALAAVQERAPALELRPLLLLGIVSVTAVGGLTAGVVYAVVSSLVLSYFELGAAVPASGFELAVDLVLPAAGCACIAVLVSFIDQGMNRNRQLVGQLALADSERRRLQELERSSAASTRMEADYRALGESIPFGIWQTDATGRLTYMSASFREMSGMTQAEIESGGWTSLVLAPDAEIFLSKWAKRDESGSDFFEGEYRIRGVDGRVYAVLSRGVRLKDDDGRSTGWVGFSLDITDRKRAMDAVALLEEAGSQLMRSLDPATILDCIAQLCTKRICDACIIDIVQEDGALSNAVASHTDSTKLSLVRDLLAYPMDQRASSGPPAVARTGKAELHATITDEQLQSAARDDRHLQILRSIGFRSALIVPLISRQKVLGTITLVSSASGRHFDGGDLLVATVLGARTALAYDNAMLYAREARVADTLQRAMLPADLPALPGIQISGTYLPGSSDSEVGGDWYDAFVLPDGHIGITIGDVAGKGLRAAAAMGHVRQALRAAAFDGLSPSAALVRVNRILCHDRTGMVTAVTATLDPTTNVLRYAIAGHPAPLIASTDGRVGALEQSGVPLGLFSDSAYRQFERTLQAGDFLVLFTDGLTEFDRDITAGEALLRAVVADEASRDSPNAALSIRQSIVADHPKDDVAVVAVRLSDRPIDRLELEAPAIPASAGMLRRALRRLAATAGLDDENAFPLLVAAGEAISNVIEHAYGYDADGTVRVRGHVDRGALIVEVSDSGTWRPPREEGRGRGLNLIRSIVDSAEVEVGATGTRVRLAMRLGRRPAR